MRYTEWISPDRIRPFGERSLVPLLVTVDARTACSDICLRGVQLLRQSPRRGTLLPQRSLDVLDVLLPLLASRCIEKLRIGHALRCVGYLLRQCRLP